MQERAVWNATLPRSACSLSDDTMKAKILRASGSWSCTQIIAQANQEVGKTDDSGNGMEN